jgi:hypothetical protein
MKNQNQNQIKNDDNVLDLLSKIGIRNVNRFLKKENGLISCIANYVIYEKNLQAIVQFRAKLNEIGEMSHIKANFSLWSSLLRVSLKVLTDVDVIYLFEYATSRTCTVNRQKKKDFVYYFNRYLT